MYKRQLLDGVEPTPSTFQSYAETEDAFQHPCETKVVDGVSDSRSSVHGAGIAAHAVVKLNGPTHVLRSHLRNRLVHKIHSLSKV